MPPDRPAPTDAVWPESGADGIGQAIDFTLAVTLRFGKQVRLDMGLGSRIHKFLDTHADQTHGPAFPLQGSTEEPFGRLPDLSVTSVGSGKVRDRVRERKSAKRSLSCTVRASRR